MNKERSVFGGWEAVPGKPGEYRVKVITGSVTSEFATPRRITSRDIVEWLRVKIKQLSEKEPPTQKGD